MVSVIIPTYNEESVIERNLGHLSRANGDFEVLVVDGESTDGTRARVEALMGGFPRPLRLAAAPRNRALQLNRGAELARGETLLFLHADIVVPPEAIEATEQALSAHALCGGNFSLVFAGPSAWNRFFTWANRARRRFGIYYGDSGIFVRRQVFERLGGFKPIPVMDDYEFIRRMEKLGRTLCLPATLKVSDRRWRRQGALRTLLSWVLVQSLYSAGVPAQRLAWLYAPVREDRLLPPPPRRSPAEDRSI
jgi:rSAM/selenodomain-associated transferase 2